MNSPIIPFLSIQFASTCEFISYNIFSAIIDWSQDTKELVDPYMLFSFAGHKVCLTDRFTSYIFSDKEQNIRYLSLNEFLNWYHNMINI